MVVYFVLMHGSQQIVWFVGFCC